jgi:hypothetical protein
MLAHHGTKVCKLNVSRVFWVEMQNSTAFFSQANAIRVQVELSIFLSLSTDCAVHIHPDGQGALETGDFFTTWANRFDSDMPPVKAERVDDGEVFALGNGQVESISIPGHSSDGMGYWIPDPENDGRWGVDSSGRSSYSMGLAWWMSARFDHQSSKDFVVSTQIFDSTPGPGNQRRATHS